MQEKPTRIWILLAVFCICVGIFLTQSADGGEETLTGGVIAFARIKPEPFPVTVQDADLIVLGTVVDIGKARFGDPDVTGDVLIWTPVGVLVERCLKGQSEPGRIVTVAQLGGTVGDVTMLAPGEPTFHPGQKVLILLYHTSAAWAQWTQGSLYPINGAYVEGLNGHYTNELRPGERFTLPVLQEAVLSALRRP